MRFEQSEPLETNRFVDEHFGEWYQQGLPAHLAEQFSEGRWLPENLRDFEGMEMPGFEQALTQALTECHEPRNAYHNLTHAQRVTENAAVGYDGLQRLTGQELPEGFLQPVLLGTAKHDHGHPGTTFFSDATAARIPEGASTDMAVERYSAEQSSLFVAGHGGTPEQQLVAAYVPSASAYGVAEEQGKRLGIEQAANPEGIAGRMMRAVDVLPAQDFTYANLEDTSVVYGEKMPGGKEPPATLAAYCEHRTGFLAGYVLPTLERLDEAAGVDLTTYLGWRERVERQLDHVRELQNGHSPVLEAILRSSAEARFDGHIE
ncbi:MAG TPA: hypothetical protein VJP80_02615 [Candidatus Saccharimonadales bacterium]|nr:hypothetical protein [Candidatus Saccharimonadales bacterium]